MDSTNTTGGNGEAVATSVGLAGGGASEDDGDDDGPCSWCGGSGDQDPDDPLWEGFDIINCKSCGGTGLVSKQTIW